MSNNFVGIELDWLVTLGTVTLVRVKSAMVIYLGIHALTRRLGLLDSSPIKTTASSP